MKGRTDTNKDFNGTAAADSSENVSLSNPFLPDDFRKELQEINKHEIIVKICEMIGPSPSNLYKAEEIFENIKYDIANFIIHHEYDSRKGVSSDLLLWLDSRTNPDNLKKLSNFIDKFFK